MVLRNKKTGQEGNFIINKDHFECVDLDCVPFYFSLSELLDEWEDYAPKEPTRCKPELGYKYYLSDSNGSIYDSVWSNDYNDRSRSKIGNCFQTKEEAEKVVEYLKALAIVRGDATTKFIKGQDNWSVHYYAPHNCLDVADNSYCVRNGIFGLPYFATRDEAQRSIEQHKNEWLTIFGVKEEE